MRPNLRVLLVEDDDDDASLTNRAFRKQTDVELTRVVTGEEALAYLRNVSNQKPDIVLLDLNLPGISGHDVLEAAKADPAIRHVPIVALSSSRSKDDIFRGWDLQVAGYLAKPVAPRDFRELAHNLVAWWKWNELST